MKKLLFVITILCFIGCKDDNKDDLPTTVDIRVDVKYYSHELGQYVSDVGSVVYLLNGFSIYNGGDWEYTGNGVFRSKRWGSQWEYTHKAIVSDAGALFKDLEPVEGYKYFTIAVESASDIEKENRSYGTDAFNILKPYTHLSYNYGSSFSFVE